MGFAIGLLGRGGGRVYGWEWLRTRPIIGSP